MTFKRTVKPTFSTVVTVSVPNDEQGFDKQVFTAVFKRPSETEKKALLKVDNDALVRTQLVGWDLVDDETKQPVAFGAEEVAALMEISPTPMATAMAFWEALAGARAKNL